MSGAHVRSIRAVLPDGSEVFDVRDGGLFLALTRTAEQAQQIIEWLGSGAASVAQLREWYLGHRFSLGVDPGRPGSVCVAALVNAPQEDPIEAVFVDLKAAVGRAARDAGRR